MWDVKQRVNLSYSFIFLTTPYFSVGSSDMTATYLITGGVDLLTVAGKLGHANSTTIQLVYSHLVKSSEKITSDMMESFIQTSTKKAQMKAQNTGQ